MNEVTQTIHPYDRLYGSLHNVGLATKATTIKYVEPVTGRTRTYIIQTIRHEDGDYLFIEELTSDGNVRVALPPAVTRSISSQRDALTTRNRSRASKRSMATRMADPNWKPPVPPQRRKKA